MIRLKRLLFLSYDENLLPPIDHYNEHLVPYLLPFKLSAPYRQALRLAQLWSSLAALKSIRDDAGDDAPGGSADVDVAPGDATSCETRLRERPWVSPRYGDEFDDVVDPGLQAAQGPPARVH